MNLFNSLKKLVISSARIRLLKVIFSSPDKIFYVRELAKLSGEELSAVRRELENLKVAEILASERRANKIFYWANNKHPLFQDVLSIILKIEGLGKELIENRQRLGKIKFILFSGHFTRNLSRIDDEVDILVVGRVVLPELGALIRKEETRRGKEINYTVMESKEFRFRKKNRDPFLLQILLRGGVMIIGDAVELIDY